jgi:hypothetical protein
MDPRILDSSTFILLLAWFQGSSKIALFYVFRIDTKVTNISCSGPETVYIYIPACRIYGFNLLKPSGNYMYHPLQQSLTLRFVFMGSVRLSV